MNAFAVGLGSFALFAVLLPAQPPARLDLHSTIGGELLLTAYDRRNRSWILESSDNLIDWLPVGDPVHVRNSIQPTAAGEALRTPAGTRYFRLADASSGPARVLEMMVDLPAGIHPYRNAATNGRIIDRMATAGRVLFHDRRLSKDNSVSCASCHLPEHAFGDNKRFSPGHAGKPTIRNTSSLTHVHSYDKGGLFWDGREGRLENAVMEPISHPDEMGLSLAELQAKLSGEPYYRELFKIAFGSEEVTTARISTALSNFTGAMDTANSKYDEAVRTSFSNFTELEFSGRGVFARHCQICHPTGTFTTGGMANNGLEIEYADAGLGALTGLDKDMGKFRIPSLRQVALTAPYMHDGRFASLREVIDFYNQGVARHRNLSPPLSGAPMNLTETEKQALEAFLETLTDRTAIDDPAFSDPFRKE